MVCRVIQNISHPSILWFPHFDRSVASPQIMLQSCYCLDRGIAWVHHILLAGSHTTCHSTTTFLLFLSSLLSRFSTPAIIENSRVCRDMHINTRRVHLMMFTLRYCGMECNMWTTQRKWVKQSSRVNKNPLESFNRMWVWEARLKPHCGKRRVQLRGVRCEDIKL